jgi:hypothetical protein
MKGISISKKQILTVLGILILIGIIGLSPPKTSPGEYVYEEPKPQATLLPTSGECGQYTVQEDRDTCYKDLAENNVDASKCEKIISGGTRSDCLEHIRATYLRNTNNTKICENITSSDEKSYCLALVTLDYSLCSKISEQLYRNNCYYSVGMSTGDQNACEKIIDDPVDHDDCYHNSAKINRDPSICQKMELESSKETCLRFVK